MRININPCALPLSERTLTMLSDLITTNVTTDNLDYLTCNFRDSTYSAEDGGYHPVEVALRRNGDNWDLLYITDFAYSGGPFPELAIEVDFNFEAGKFFMAGMPPLVITHHSVQQFFKDWLSNFIAYVKDGSFDHIRVSP